MSTKKKNKSLVKKTRKNRFKNKLSTHIMKGGLPKVEKLIKLEIDNTTLIDFDDGLNRFTFTGVAASENHPKIEKIIFQKQSGIRAPLKILNIFFASVKEGHKEPINYFLAQRENIYNYILGFIISDDNNLHFDEDHCYLSSEINNYLTTKLSSIGNCRVVGSNIVDGRYVVQDVRGEVHYEFTLNEGRSISIRVGRYSLSR